MVAGGPMSDDLMVGCMGAGASLRHPGHERGVHLLDGGEGPSGEHVVADDQNLALDPALAGGAVGSQHVDVEVAMAGETHRFRVQRDCFTWRDMPADDGFGPVVDDRHRHPAVVGERPPVAVEEGLQILAGGEAAERVAGVRQGHVERIDLRDAQVGEDSAFVAPVDLGLGPGHDLEAAVHACQLSWRDAQFLGDPWAGLLQIELDPLVVDGGAVVLHQALVHHRTLDEDLRLQHGVNQRRDLVHGLLAWPTVRHPPRTAGACPDRYLRTVFRFRPVSLATSVRVTAPDSKRARKRRSSNQRCGSKTIVSCPPPPLTDQ